ncbi:MAG: signal peptidase I, partial [Flavobacteriaceae bacterium]|nr:signal peptidase I [Flavobacteriaceae bacterium]
MFFVLIHFHKNYLIATVQAYSMEPTYHSGEKVLYKTNTGLKRKDVIILRASDNSLFIKRLLGMPGDTINFDNGLLVLNKSTVMEPYVQSKKAKYNFTANSDLNTFFTNQYTVPYKGLTIDINEDTLRSYKLLIEDIENKKITQQNDAYYLNGRQINDYVFPLDCYYILGDNRNNSKDSRTYGAIPEKNIAALSSSETWYSGYQLVKKIYDSTETTVYQAKRVSDPTDVALRLSTTNHASNNPYQTRLKHDNVIRCFEKSNVKIEQLSYHLSVLEWGGIQKLRQWLMQNKTVNLHLILMLLNGLEYLHANGIIHADLKPENILVNFQEQKQTLKLIDYGQETRLPDGSFKITPEYAPPEYQSGPTIQTDIWALGCIIYEIFTGRVL